MENFTAFMRIVLDCFDQPLYTVRLQPVVVAGVLVVYLRQYRRRFYWGYAQMNKLPYFLVALCLCMFCSFSAYADDTPPADSPPDTTPIEDTLSNSSVQVSDPALYAKLDTLQESIDKLTDALTPAAEDDDTPAEDTAAPDYTNQLSTISGQLLELQEAPAA